MDEEDSEKKISFDCLRTMVDEAIKTKNICIIERIEKENLRYAQKYTESLISKDELVIGVGGFILAIAAIGASYVAVDTPHPSTLGYILLFLALGWLFLWKFKLEPHISFKHEIILKIEEKLSNRT